MWNKKFHKSLGQPLHINGLNDNKLIVEEFAKHFSEVYDKAADTHSLHDNNSKTNDITFELTANCISKLKLGRTPGPDLTAEHLVYAHQSLIYHLSLLFRGMATHSFVPQAFAQGLIVPLVKDKSDDLCSLNNYRGIILTPVISKLFESILLNKCEEHLVIDELQFGFKKATGCQCPQAVFTLQPVVEYTLMLEAVQHLQPRWILLKHLTLLSTHYYFGL